MNFFTKTSLLGLLFILFQFSLQAQNCTVNANVSQTICSNETLTLQGNDNGLPGFTFLGWKQISGPSVSITTPLNLQTTVTGFTAGNTYVFRLSALCTDKSTVSDDVTVVVRPITIANAGADVTHCPGNYSLTANNQGVGENGEWSIVGNNGAGIAISNVFSPNSSYSISGTSAGSTTLRWTITNIASGCNSYDEVVITSPGGINPVSAGSDQNLSKCYSSTQSTSLSGSFGGNGLGGQQGTWTVVSGPSVPLFSNPNSSSTDVNGLQQGTYVFRWTVSGPCANGFDEVAITVPAPTADITPLDDVTLTYCDKRTTALLTGKVPNFINETVSWTQVSGPSLAVIATPNSSSTNVSGLLGVGTYSFRYTISNSITGCLSSAVYKIVFANTPTISAGPDLNLGCNITQVNIPINQSGDGETSWQIVNGPVNPNFPSYPTSLVKFSGNVLKIEGLITGGAYDFRVVKTAPTGNLCSSVSDDIKVVVSIEPSLVNAGTAEVLDCSATTAVLAGNIPKSGIGKWTQASGPNQAIIADPFDASTEVSGLINGEYTFEWAILGGPECIETIGLVRVLVSEIEPEIPIAGNDQTVCYGSPIQLDGSIPKLNEKGKWTVISPINGSFNISDIENPKAIFIGYDPGTVYTLRWTVSNSCASLYDEVLITTNDKQGPIAIAEDDVCYPSGTSTFNLKATDPFPGAGFWRQIKGPTVTIDNPNSFNTTVTNVIDGVYEFEWAIVSGSCEPTNDTVIINVANDVTPSVAGQNQTICSATTTLDANVPLVGQGIWTLVSANRTIIIKEPTNPKTVVENLPVGTWVFSWTITNGNCGTSVSSMQVTVEDKPSIAFAGFDQEKCDNSPVIMNAINPIIGLGTWSLVSGPNNPTFSDFNSPNTVIEDLISGTYIFRWTVSAGLCPDNFDTVQVVVRDIANAGNDVITCDVGAVPLIGTIGTIGTWSVVSGPGNPIIISTGVNSASATNLSKGETIFRYTIPAVGSCPESIDDVSVIIVGEPSSADAGPDQVLCNNGIIQLNGNIPAIGNGKWSILSGPTTGTFVPSDTAPNATYTNAPSGVYVFQWTISDAGCSNTDQVRVENNETPTNPDAGPDQNQVCGSSTVLAANTPVFGVGNWTQISGPSSAVFSSVILPNPTVTNLVAGDYVFEWSISNGTVCPIERDQVAVKVFTAPTTPDAGPNQRVCEIVPFLQLGGNTITVGTGKWSIYSGPAGTFSDDLNPNANFTPSGPGTYILAWTATNSPCSLVDYVDIIIDAQPTAADAGPEIKVCKATSLFMNANTPVIGIGTWKSKGGPTNPVFVNPNSPTTQVLGLDVGEYFFSWEIENGACNPSVDNLRVTIDPEATLANAGSNQTICNTTTATMSANVPVEGTGLWSFVINPGGAIITDPTSPTSTITGITVGVYRLRWTISNACGSNSSEVNVERISDLVTTAITPNQTICLGGTATFTTTASGGAVPYTYEWQSSSDNVNWNPISGQNTNQYVSPNNLAVGTYYYRVKVSNSCSTIYSNAAEVVVVNDPIITTQPVGNTICSGNTHAMNVIASGGTGTLLYQWQDSNDNSTFNDISGANSASYTTASLTANKFYRVKITQAASGCEVISNSVPVYVTTIVEQPTNPPAICVGGFQTLTAAASLNGGTGTLNYQWQFSPNGNNSWADVSVGSGINTPNYVTDNLAVTTWFRCKITSTETACSLFTNAARVTVVADPAITTQPVGTTICVGGSETLSVTATGGTPSLTYQWQVSSTSGSGFTDISGARGSTYNTGVINTVETRYYRVIVAANGFGCNPVTSDEAVVTVVPDPIVTDQPDDITICDGTSTTLNVVATGGTGTLLYQWQSSSNGTSFANISGATSSSYLTPTLTNDTFYKVIITQAASGCRVDSNIAKVSVAKISVQPSTPVAICVGGVVSISVTTTVVPGATYAYQWQSSTNGTVWNNESNASASTANFISDVLNATTQFRCEVTVSNPNCSLISIPVTATVVPDPTIDTQPTGGTICTGGNFNLSVQASNGTPSLTYQWQSSTTSGSGFTDISGATNSNLSVTSLTQTTYYRVNVSASGNGCNTITSSEAEVIVIPDPIIVTQPVSNTTICKNGTATLSVVASGGSGTFSYQWQSATSLGGTYSNISGATSNTYTTSSLSATSYFRVVIANSGAGCNTLTSTEASIFVGDIIVQPVAPAPICIGGAATVSLTASANGGTATFTYQWESSPNGTSGWSSIGGATSNSYTTPALSSTTYYRCIVTSATPICTLTSDVVKVDVVPDPTIITQPADGIICTGGFYNLSVGATNGTPSLTYQWQSSASLGGTYTDISGATSSNYSTPALTATSYYRVLVSASGDGCTTVTSNPATVTVVADPLITSQPLGGEICVGNSYSFSVVATGSIAPGTVTYQWQVASVISGPFSNVTTGVGGTSSNYTTPVFSSAGNRYYRVLVSQSNAGCQTISNTVTLVVAPKPIPPTGTITQQPNCATATGVVLITNPAEGTGYEYSKDVGLTYQSSATFSNLSSGQTNISVRKIGVNTCFSTATSFAINNRICANPETFVAINGALGGSTTTVLGSDTLNGSSALLSLVTIRKDATSSSNINLNTITGIITVTPNTPAGTYTVDYTICEKSNPTNCSSTRETIVVVQSPIDAVDDIVNPSVNGFVGTVNAINVLTNDRLNAVVPDLSKVVISIITPAIAIGGSPIPVLNPQTGLVAIPAGTPAGNYTIEYQICEVLNPTNCDRATIFIPVVAPIIDAINDNPIPVNGTNGNSNLVNVISNDLLNGSGFALNKVNLNQVTAAVPIRPGALIPLLDITTGVIRVPAGTPAGAYTITYSICEKLNPTNCDTATVTILVSAATLIANDDLLGPINGYVGNPNLVNAYFVNDRFNGKVVDLSLVTPTILNTAIPVRPGALVPILNEVTGVVSVPAGTPADDYTIQYQLCEKLNPTNCDVALINIRVVPAPLVAVDDFSLPINGKTGAPLVLNAFNNDTFNATSLVLSEITRTIVTPAISVSGGPVPVMDPITGNVSVPPNTPAGAYTITYRLCEILNPSNCDVATITINVVAAPIIANDNFVTVNGFTGGSNILLAIFNDILNGQTASLSEVEMTVVTPAVPINGGTIPVLNPTTSYVSVPAGTPSGTYTIEYRICEKLNPTNCDTAIINIIVRSPKIIAENDIVVSFNGFLGDPNIGNVLTNDLLNGASINRPQVVLSLISGATSIGGAVPVLDLTTGLISVLPGTPNGTYFIEYGLCESLNPNNCDNAIVKIEIASLLGSSSINAVEDEVKNINGYTGVTAVLNVLANDTSSSLPANFTNVTLSLVKPASPILSTNVPVLDIATGLINVPKGTSAGTYTIIYSICQKLNPTVCDLTIVTIEVLAPLILANDDNLSGINGMVGQTNAINALNNDTLNGGTASINEVGISVVIPAKSIRGNVVPFLDEVSGNVTIPAGTPAGNYSIVYTICEKNNPTNCATATINIDVVTAPIVANDDTVAGINGFNGAIDILDVLANDLLNGSPALLSQNTVTILTPAASIGGGLVPTLNSTTGKVTVPAQTPAGTYTIEYELCEQLNPMNCDRATVTVTVDAPPIIAVDDLINKVNGFTGASNIVDVLLNDSFNGSSVTLPQINLSVVTEATPINGGLVPVLDLNTGKVNVPAMTPAGDYVIRYRICGKLNPTNCDDAIIKVNVIAPILIANADFIVGVNGYTGATNIINALDNDRINGQKVESSKVRISIISLPVSILGRPVPILDKSTGLVTVPPNTPAGTYVIGYQICELINPTNCDAAKIVITVRPPAIDAVDNSVKGVNGYTGAIKVIEAIANDLLNGSKVKLSEIKISLVTPAVSLGGAVPVLNTTNGFISVPPGTTAGTYTITYKICELINPTNCDSATITIQVVAPEILALEDRVSGVNGAIGATNVINALTNDLLNNNPVALSEVTILTVTPAVPIAGGAVPILNSATGAVDVPANTPNGEYIIIYSICEKRNPTNCSQSRIVIDVAPSQIIANNDAASGIDGFVGAVGVLDVLNNDTLNANPALLSNVTISVLSTATALSGGQIPFLDISTGLVTVPPGTTAGGYTIVYQICENLNPNNCSTASVKITVGASSIIANSDIVLGINGYNGAIGVLNALSNDTLAGLPADLNDVTMSVIIPASSLNGGPVPFLDTTTGLVDVPPGTPARNYFIIYGISENLNPTVFDIAIIIINVVPAPIDAVDDKPLLPINGKTGSTSVINAFQNDRFNGNSLNLSELNITVTKEAGTSATIPYPKLDPTTGVVSVPPGTPKGIYTIAYKICEKLNPNNCDSAQITITVFAAPIVAEDDFVGLINGFDGANAIMNVTTNDKLNFVPIVFSDIQLQVLTQAVPINGGLVPIIDETTGLLSVPPGTAQGIYSIEYEICEKLNPTNCDSAVAYVAVESPIIVANNDTYANVNGFVGASNVFNAITNDLLNGSAISIPKIKIKVTQTATSINGGLVPNLDEVSGYVNIPAGTPAGLYTINYSICEVINPNNCDTASITILVNPPIIDAINDNPTATNGTAGNPSVVNVLSNDTLNGSSFSSSLVNLILVTKATPVFVGAPVPTLDVTNGIVRVPAGTPIGAYAIEYQICEKINPNNCDNATVLINVVAAPIVANDDFGGPINGYLGSTNVINAFTNDTLNGIPITQQFVQATIVNPAAARFPGAKTPILDVATGVVSIPAGTPVGTYTIVYQICERLNPTNCDNAIVRVQVVAAPIAGIDDVVLGINGLVGNPNAFNAYANDTLDGKPLITNEISFIIVQPATSIGGGPVPTLNLSSGIVSVPAGTTAGTYTIVYQICEKLNPTNCDTATITIQVQEPKVVLIKKGVFVDANGDGFAQAGESIRYTFTVTNSGSMALTDLVVTDPKVIVTGVPISSLAVGASNTTNYSATYTLTQADIDAGKFVNQAVVAAKPIVGLTITNLSDSDDLSLPGKNDPTVTLLNPLKQLTLIKKGDLQGLGAVGDKIQYTFTLRNTGTVTLTNVEITDPMLSANPIKVTPSQVLPGETRTVVVLYTITAKDFAAGEVINSALGYGDAPDGTLVTDISDWDNAIATGPDDPTIVQISEQPKIALLKTATFDDNNNDGKADVGETVTYRFSVSNTGNVPLSNVVITDDKIGINVLGNPISLAVGATDSDTFRAVYVLTKEDINAGMVENQAKAKGVTPKSVVVEDLSDPNTLLADNPTVLSFVSCQLIVYNAMSPNADGLNDYFKIEGVDCFENVSVDIYDRWGVLVFSGQDYDNNTVVFRGISEGRSTIKRGSRLPDGTYYYVIKYKNYLGNSMQKVGYLFISY